jgi:hypothetical protein
MNPYNQQYYNPNPYMNKMNMTAPNCMTCNNTGYFRSMNNIMQTCQCQNLPIGQPYYHQSILDSIGNKFRAISNCLHCRGSGYMLSKHGNQTFCGNCISSNRYCPKCNNTGYKLKNGKHCKHKF